jgi:hypothetical protein
MGHKEYEVEVVSRQRTVYRVSAADRERAEEEAAERWKRGDPSDIEGYDWSELEATHAMEIPDARRRAEDGELILRFLRERERLILRLGGSMYGGTNNDAISASQVASDLGWSRRRHDGVVVPDEARAAQTLEHLCESHELVCFERPRVREGERGPIRLYCTPGYLERLTSSLGGLVRHAV